jgi:transcriptional regulator with XRE-family HTH domain
MRVRHTTNKALAKAVGVHVKTVSPWLSDRVEPDEDRMVSIADELQVPVIWLRYGRGPSGLEGSVSRGTHRPSPKVYERIWGYLERMRRAGIYPEEIDEAERLFADANFAKLYSGGRRELTEEEILLDIDATWEAIKLVYRKKTGRSL